jgi:hypothetical protein
MGLVCSLLRPNLDQGTPIKQENSMRNMGLVSADITPASLVIIDKIGKIYIYLKNEIIII